MTIGPFRRILVGWDCSQGATAALHAAAALADSQDAHVVALAVLGPAPQTEDTAEGAADLGGRQRFARETFAEARNSLPGSQQDQVTLQFAESGDAARAVREYARQNEFDVLVIGRHGTGGVLHPRLGRVASAAMKDGHLTVLLVPQDPALY
ncbi:MAG: universal stress protein [Streptosporangiaceae bacterium]